MARGRGETSIDRWVETLGQQIGVQLGKVIAEHLQRTLEGSVDLGAVARRMGGGAGRRGRRPSPDTNSCNQPGCGDPALAKGLCRSHYYRARYQSQKSQNGGEGRARRGGGGRRARRARRDVAAVAGDATPA